MGDVETSPSVIIVGAGVAGLTLALSLARKGITSCILEARTLDGIHHGSSIGIFPNGGRCLEELGVLGNISESAHSVHAAFLWSEGTLLRVRRYPEIVNKRLGYPYLFCRRKVLIDILRRTLPPSTSKIFFEKRVCSVQQDTRSATVKCADGSIFRGNIVAGADGSHSVVRRWISMDKPEIGYVGSRKKETSSEVYSCVYGISAAIEKLPAGTMHNSYGHHYSIFTTRNGSETFWCVYIKGLQMTGSGVDDPAEVLEPFADKYVAFDVQLRSLIATSVTCVLFPLDDYQYKNWSLGRLVCIGDSVHKMAPNLGQGGNMAIEDALTLANCLNTCLPSSAVREDLPLGKISDNIRRWQDTRYHRVAGVWHQSRWLLRTETFSKFSDYLVGRYIIPHLDNYLADAQSEMMRSESVGMGNYIVRTANTKMEYIPEGFGYWVMYIFAFAIVYSLEFASGFLDSLVR